MRDFNQINYALITALYADNSRGLYSDIYFPIIKYAIVNVISKNDGRYVSAEDIQNDIKEKFHLLIPNIVIIKSIKKLAKGNNTEIIVYDDVDCFQIKDIDFKEEFEKCVEKEENFQHKIEELEKDYSQFIQREGVFDDKMSFRQFISSNTNDVLELLSDNQSDNSCDNKYTTLIFFIQYLKDKKNDLYEIAVRLFWSSVIAAFLVSEKPQVCDSENGISSEYYLDTPIALGLLKLSTPQREASSIDICEIIKSSKGLLRIHPMTLKEIKQILENVERNGAYPGSDIESAYNRYSLKISDLAGIRVHLSEKLEQLGVLTYPNDSPNLIQSIVSDYENKAKVRELGKMRQTDFPDHNLFRNIHDIFMDDYIKETRKKKHNNDNIFFLTSNSDLVYFCEANHKNVFYTVDIRKVTLDLWMHNSKSMNVSECVLMETMARCLDSHNVQVRRKLKEISKYYNATKDNFDLEIYRDFVGKLYRRAKNVINAVEDEENYVNDSWSTTMKEAVYADNKCYDDQIAILKKENEKQVQDIETQKGEISRLSETIEKVNSRVDVVESEKNNIIQKQLLAEEQLKLYKRKDEIKDNLQEIEQRLKPLEDNKSKAFCNWQPYLFFSISIVGAIVFIIVSVYNKNLNLLWLNILISPFIAGGISACLNKNERNIKALELWEKKNPQYGSLKEEKDNLMQELSDIESRIE